jgi:outer membrane protein OmpA-like peptidoglycan-associated protein
MRCPIFFLFWLGLLLASPVYPITHAQVSHAALPVQDPAGGKAIGDGLRVDFYNGINFDHKAHSRIEQQVDYQWAHPVYAQGLEGLEFSARWRGRLRAPVDGDYKLVIKVDDGARLWLDGKLLIDEWYKISGQSITINVKPVTYTADVKLKRGRFYDLKIEYFNYLGPGVIKLYWESPQHETENFFGLITTRKRVKIPQEYLFSAPPDSAAEPLAVTRLTTKAAALPKAVTPSAKKPVARALAPPLKQPATKAPDNQPAPLPVALGNGRDKEAPKEEVFGNLEAGKAVVLNQVLFEQSKYVLLPGSYGELDKLVNTLRKFPVLHITIAGHTDDVGDPRLNQALSENRAAVVANYLVRNGIAESRIQTRGYGSSRPVASNTTETDRARNRRVEFTVEEGF